jgi:hypothetical protein
MKTKRLWLSLFVSLLLPSSVYAGGPSAQEIMDKALEHNAMGFQAGQAQIALAIQDKAGTKRVRTMEVKSKKMEDASTRTLVTLTSPKEVKGQAFLFAENKGAEDDVWMYVPAFSVTRRIEGGQKKGAFLGSHFTYADLESRDMKNGAYKKLPDKKIGKMDVFVVSATPNKDNGSEYTQVVVYVRKTDFVPVKMEFFGKTNTIEKVLFVETLDTSADGKTYAKQMTLRPSEGGFTSIRIDALDNTTDLPTAAFSKDRLGK